MSLFSKKDPQLKAKSCAAVLVAAGSATRMEGIDKVLAPVGAEPMVVRAVRAFEINPFITEIVVVTREELVPEIFRLCREAGFAKVKTVLTGGATRTESVRIGLDCISKKTKLAAIHDAARPLVSQEVISSAILKAAETGAAAPAIPAKDTMKLTDADRVVTETPQRDRLFAVQTPQVFDLDFIRCALQKALEEDLPLTDDCMAAELLGMKVHLTQGSERNLKVTTPLDLQLVNLLAEETE